MRRKLGKYLTLIRIGWQGVLAYRTEAILWALIDFLPLLTQFFIWQAIFQQRQKIRGMNFEQVVTYYFLLAFVKGITRTYFEGRMIGMIKKGEIAILLLKPLNIFSFFVIREISWKIIRQSFTFLLTIMAFVLLRNKIAFHLTSGWSLLVLLAFVIIGFSISALLSFLVGIAAFWFEEARSLIHARWILVGFLSGSFFPLVFLPVKVQRLAYFLPFRFVSFTPVNFLAGQEARWPQELFWGVIWLFLLALLVSFCWQKGVKKFTAVGN